MSDLNHVDAEGRVRMVDVSAKDASVREAEAEGAVRFADAATLEALGRAPKGDVLATARLAGVMAAKHTATLIPLCHPLLIDHVEVDAEPDAALPGIRLRSRVRCNGRTGVEMEALTAVSVAALTVVDMVKALDRWSEITGVRLVAKRGGRSGEVRRPPPEPPPGA